MIIKNQHRPSSVDEAISYFDLMASYLDVLRNIQSEVRNKISYDVKMNIIDAKYRTYIGVAIVVVVLLVSPIIILLVKNATNTIQVSISRSSAAETRLKCAFAKAFAHILSEKQLSTPKAPFFRIAKAFDTILIQCRNVCP